MKQKYFVTSQFTLVQFKSGSLVRQFIFQNHAICHLTVNDTFNRNATWKEKGSKSDSDVIRALFKIIFMVHGIQRIDSEFAHMPLRANF